MAILLRLLTAFPAPESTRASPSETSFRRSAFSFPLTESSPLPSSPPTVLSLRVLREVEERGGEGREGGRRWEDGGTLGFRVLMTGLFRRVLRRTSEGRKLPTTPSQ